MKVQTVTPKYVEQLPEVLDEGVLYISESFALTAHKCCCGCGEDVYNKLGPARWQLIKLPGAMVTLYPSIGNWNYTCRSHYWIRSNRVIDAGLMSERRIKAAQRRDRRDRHRNIAAMNATADELEKESASWWRRIHGLVARATRRLRAYLPW